MNETRIHLLEHQQRFIMSLVKILLLAGGIGSGKSYAGSHYVIKKCVTDGKGMGFIGANTYRQLMNSTLACLFRELERYQIPYSYKENKGKLKILNTDIITGSLDNYDVHRGIEISWFWIDETRDTPLEAFLMLIGRLRDKRSKMEGRLTTSLSGFNWLYDYFHGEKMTDDFGMIKARSQDNIFLPDEYLTMLEDIFDSLMYRQEVLAEFINIASNRVYYAFDRERNVRPIKYDSGPLWLGQDFNINPMTATIGRLNSDKLEIFDEAYIMTSNTEQICKEIKRRYADTTLINSCPDATGRARKTSSEFTDIQICGKYFKMFHGPSNPAVIDRYNCVNNLLEKERLIVDNKCKYLIRDLEQCVYKKGTRHIDDKDPKLVHISDALGYKCFWHYGKKREDARVSYYA